jgi:hypothetical protein
MIGAAGSFAEMDDDAETGAESFKISGFDFCCAGLADWESEVCAAVGFDAVAFGEFG